MTETELETNNPLLAKFLAVEADLEDVLLERRDEIHAAMLCILAKKHMFMLGSPGVAKSMTVDEIARRITGLDENGYFKWLLTKFSVPEELFGGPDFKLMRDEGIYKRRTGGKLPTAHFAFLDEVFKANSAILNALLKMMNEREFDNPGDDPRVPLCTMFTASNELPASAELDALADRLHFWFFVKPIGESSNFVKMLTMQDREPRAFISIDDITQAQREIDDVIITDEILDCILELRERLSDDEVTVTDRRFRQAMDVIRAEAWMNGHNIAEVYDMKPLMHMLWRDPAQMKKVQDCVLDLTDALEKEAREVRDEFDAAYAEFRRVIDDSEHIDKRAKQGLATYEKYKQAMDDWKRLNERRKEMNRPCKALKDLKARLDQLGPIILEEGLGVSREQVESMKKSSE